MTASPPARPLPPVLGRMAVGLLVAGAGALVAWQGVGFSPTPGMAALSTPLSVPLDDPRPAASASVHLRGDRVDVSVNALDAGSPWLLRGSALHRGRNPVTLETQRDGDRLNASVALRVQNIDRGGVIVSGPEPLQHHIALALSRDLPLSLAAQTSSGDQSLDLTTLRIRALSVRTGSGGQQLTLPARAAGPLSLVSASGDVTVRAPTGASPEALRVNTQSGELSLDLAGARTLALGAGALSGDVRLTLPVSFARGTVTTSSGDVTITAPATLRSGNLDVRTQSGNVTLRVPSALRVRVRFTDRDTVILPPGTPPATAPQLDVFVDSGGEVRVQRPDGTDVPLPGAAPTLPPPAPPTTPVPPLSAEPTTSEETP
ncbi:hypothetical protein HNQ07_000055 [Deinococcus metalli]|uniref:DUF4097 domain-containing protein n=1 Tax=Deinococcus metalli TaxID=1141878 RepID=A0A7W8KCP3_9DEIO|nr:DUF4097 family beta strand repeat-containing protein [Deinococcus metalli]MBB5374611.1 hypothetical protein [Deinococcus metalli]GHF35028.1 hypothetical protein GCM10017781_09860 [Deinococcus metalli]